MQVIGNRVMIVPDEKKSATPTGLILPQQAQEASQVGTVIAVGYGRYSEKYGTLIPIDFIDVGDRVLFSKYGGTVIEVDEEEILLIQPDDIFAIVEEPEGDEEDPDWPGYGYNYEDEVVPYDDEDLEF